MNSNKFENSKKRSYSKVKKTWDSEGEEDSMDEEKDELELEDLLRRLLESQKELFAECQKLKDVLSQVQQQYKTLNN